MVVELRVKITGTAFLLLVLIIACSSDAAPEPSDKFLDIHPESTMQQAVNQLLALDSASFSLKHLEGNTILVPGVLMTKVSGEVSIPGRFSVTVEAEAEFLRSYLEISIITIDETAYMTDLFTGRWNLISPDSLPFDLSDLGQTLADIVDAVKKPQVMGEERVNGVDILQISGEIASEDLAELVPGSEPGLPVRLELWLDQKQGLLQQVHIIGRVVPNDAVNTLRELTLKDINQPVVIEAPGNLR